MFGRLSLRIELNANPTYTFKTPSSLPIILFIEPNDFCISTYAKQDNKLNYRKDSARCGCKMKDPTA